ncbi:serine protease 30-like [Styela clava]
MTLFGQKPMAKEVEDTVESIIIILGANNQTNSDEIGRQYLNVEEYFLHQDYGDVIGSFFADIALLQLTTEVTYDYYVRPACLPTFGSEATVGQTCFVSGFGDTQDTGNQNILQYAGVDIISRETCNEWYSTLNLSIPSDHFCAGFEEGGIDTCQGDSGGPLVCMESSVYVARGITSFGEGCAVAQRPGAYTDVVTYMNWIIGKIDEKEKTTGAYTEYASTHTGNQNILRYAGVDIISRETCNEWYSTLNLSIPSDHFCAGFEEGGIDTCQGDSGGPLVCMKSSVYVARGITSFGEGCAVAQRPGAYTDVATYMNWIIGKIDEKVKTTGAYTEYASTRIATSESTTSHANVTSKRSSQYGQIIF